MHYDGCGSRGSINRLVAARIKHQVVVAQTAHVGKGTVGGVEVLRGQVLCGRQIRVHCRRLPGRLSKEATLFSAVKIASHENKKTNSRESSSGGDQSTRVVRARDFVSV